MNKSDVVIRVAEKTGATKSDVEKFLTAYDETIVEGLKEDNRVRINTLGFLSVVYTAPRKSHNPRNPQETFETPESAAVKFKSSESLKTEMATPEIVAKLKAKKGL